jgi:hypothetical protein
VRILHRNACIYKTGQAEYGGGHLDDRASRGHWIWSLPGWYCPRAGDSMIEYQDTWRRYRRLRNTLFAIVLMDIGPSELIYQRVFSGLFGFRQGWEYIGILISTGCIFLIDRKLRYFRCPSLRPLVFHA